MPTYEYECIKGHRLELSQPMTARPKRKCPTCGAKTHRLIGGGSGIIFRGSGFYATDYRRKPAGKAESESPKKERQVGASPKGGPGKSEAKPSDA